MPDFAQEISIWTEAARASLSRIEYNIVNLIGPPGSRNPAAFGLNELGAVAGKAEIDNPSRFGLYTPGDTGIVWTHGLYDHILPPTTHLTPTPAHPFPGFGSGLNDINWRGVAAGWRERDSATGGDIAVHAFKTDLSDVPSEIHARALAINDNGVICGWSKNGLGTRGFVYHPADGTIDHVGLPGAVRSRAVAITNFGWVAGDSDGQAFLHSYGNTRPLGPVVAVTDVNDSGLVVGALQTLGQGSAPGLCDGRAASPAWAAIQLPRRFAEGRAEAVNRFGHIVGWGRDRAGLHSAFLYKDGEAYDLNLLIDEPGWHLEVATDINDRGLICGHGTRHGVRAAWLLSPPLVLPELPPLHRRTPPVPPQGPPGPDEIALRDASILLALNRAATSIADAGLVERVRSGLLEAVRPTKARPADRIAGDETAAVAESAKGRGEAAADMAAADSEQA